MHVAVILIGQSVTANKVLTDSVDIHRVNQLGMIDTLSICPARELLEWGRVSAGSLLSRWGDRLMELCWQSDVFDLLPPSTVCTPRPGCITPPLRRGGGEERRGEGRGKKKVGTLIHKCKRTHFNFFLLIFWLCVTVLWRTFSLLQRWFPRVSCGPGDGGCSTALAVYTAVKLSDDVSVGSQSFRSTWPTLASYQLVTASKTSKRL